MQVQVTFRNVDSSDAVKQYVADKLGKLEKYLEGAVEANVTLTVTKHRHDADVTISAAGIKIHGTETTGDMYSAIDLVSDKLEAQVKRYRDKIKKYGRGQRRSGPEQDYTLGVFEKESMVSEEQPRTITSTRLKAKPMHVDEAAMQLDLSQDDFLVFINAQSQALNVIYRRGDGNFGLIEPQ
jgi:putative sigma-54 modulation protein